MSHVEPETEEQTMRGRVMSALVAGLLAAVIWMVISTAVDMSGGAVIGWGIGLLLFVGAITFVISSVIQRNRGAGG